MRQSTGSDWLSSSRAAAASCDETPGASSTKSATKPSGMGSGAGSRWWVGPEMARGGGDEERGGGGGRWLDGWIAARKLQIAMEKRTFDRKAVCVLRFFNDLNTQTMEGRLPKQPLA